MPEPTAAVVGQLARDLVLTVDRLAALLAGRSYEEAAHRATAAAGATVGHPGGRPDLRHV